ncbi:MAG: hypothetical protein AAGG68_26205 [Bacteroidota bacterium]
MHSSFSIERLGLLLRKDFNQIRKTGLIITGVGFLILFLTFYHSLSNELTGYYNQNPNFNYHNFRTLVDLFAVLFLVVGFVFTSIAYSDLIRVPKAQNYLSLPATTFEKWMSKWLLTAVAFPIAFLLLYQVFSWFCYAVGQSMGVEIITLPLFDPYVWRITSYYLVFQSIFLLGAVSLPKVSFFKTIAVGIGLVVVALLVANLVLWIIKPELGHGVSWQFDFSFSGWRIPDEKRYFLSYQLGSSLLKIFCCLFFPIIAFVSYLKLKEREA